jgi:ribosome-associated protein
MVCLEHETPIHYTSRHVFVTVFQQGFGCFPPDGLPGARTEAEGRGYMPFQITSEHIKLDSFLKAVNVVGSGGEAKLIIGEGHVLVNGTVEVRRGRKLRPGDRVELGGHAFLVERQD